MRVLMVAEKPSIAQAVANALAQGSPVRKRKGVSPSAPVFEYEGDFMGAPAEMRCTSTVGHMWSLDFGREFNDQGKVQPIELFDAPTVHLEDPRPRMTEHLRAEAAGCDALVLWLDCDREGENICFEVLSLLPQFSAEHVWRAKFSAVTEKEVRGAWAYLGKPNANESAAVDARQELDLKVGVVFTRMLTRALRDAARRRFALPSLRLLSFGPCQTPTLW